MSFALAALMEWGSPDFQHYQPLEIWLMVVLAAAFSLRWRLPAPRLVMLLLLLHMALQHRRHVEILGLIAPLLLAPALAHQLPDRPGGSPLLQWVDHAIAELKKPATGFGLALALVLFAVLTATVLPRRELHVAENITPAAAVDAVIAQHVSGPVLNDYGFGGYLIFRGFKVFIDGRADFYGDAFIKHMPRRSRCRAMSFSSSSIGTGSRGPCCRRIARRCKCSTIWPDGAGSMATASPSCMSATIRRARDGRHRLLLTIGPKRQLTRR